MNFFKKTLNYFLIINIVSFLIAFFQHFIQNNSILLSYVNSLFMISFTINIIFGFQWLRERGFFNMTVFAKDKFSQSIKKSGGNFIGSAADFLTYLKPSVLETTKNKDSKKNDEKVEVYNYTNYNEKIAWKNTKYVLLASLISSTFSVIISLFLI